MNLREKRRWRIAAAGSIGIHLLFFLFLAVYVPVPQKQPEPIYVEISLAELFSPVPDTPAVAPRQQEPPKPKPAQPVTETTPFIADRPAEATMPLQAAPSSSASSSVPASSSGSAAPVNSGGGKAAAITRGPRAIEAEKPDYPAGARERGNEGTVRLQMLVNRGGRVESVRIIESSGHTALDKAAEKAVRSWRFSPALQNGEPIAAWVTVPIVFDLR